MEFCIEKHSSVPVVRQIVEQIKLAVAMEVFRNGDTLPSIREIERQTGINRGQIHRAYLALKQSGLLVPSRGKGTVIAVAALFPHLMNEKCRQLSRNITSQVRQLGVSPAAFARYLSGYVQEVERSEPFITYVDRHKEIAVQRAAEITQLWQVRVIGLTIQELKKAVRKGSKVRRVLANHLLRDNIRSMISSKKIDVIPIEVRGTQQTIEDFARIKSNSSALLILSPPGLRNARFIIAQLRKWVKSPGVEFFPVSVRDVSSSEEVLGRSKYDWLLVGPGLRSEVPQELREDPRTMFIRLQLDPASLEAARIRAGVII